MKIKTASNVGLETNILNDIQPTLETGSQVSEKEDDRK